MSKIQRPFLIRVREAWQHRFPFLEPVEIDEIPRRDNGGNYRCSAFFSERSRAYFVAYQFSKVRRGEFTLEVTIADSLDRSILEHRTASDIAAHKLGSYRIGSFIDGKDCWWALQDVEAETRRLLPSLPIARPPGRWRPSSFDLPLDRIYDEAISDVSDKLERYVFPKLHFPDSIHTA